MNYAEMSDFEINKLVSARVFGSVVSLDDVVLNERSEPFDPCNSWADAGPIVQENMISIERHYNGSYSRIWGYSEKGLHEIHSLHDELLRSAMIVFLMMRGGE